MIGIASALGVGTAVFALLRAREDRSDIGYVALDPERAGEPARRNVRNYYSTRPKKLASKMGSYFFWKRYARVIGLTRFARGEELLSEREELECRNELAGRLRRNNEFERYINACKRRSLYRQARIVLRFAFEHRLFDYDQAVRYRDEINQHQRDSQQRFLRRVERRPKGFASILRRVYRTTSARIRDEEDIDLRIEEQQRQGQTESQRQIELQRQQDEAQRQAQEDAEREARENAEREARRNADRPPEGEQRWDRLHVNHLYIDQLHQGDEPAPGGLPDSAYATAEDLEMGPI